MPMLGLGAKTGAKTKGHRAYLLSPFDLSLKNEHLKIEKMSKLDEK